MLFRSTTTRNLWKDEAKLHHPAQNATDQCHCACESRKLVGPAETGGHTFASANDCTCTCGAYMRNTWLNACNYCSKCDMIHMMGINGYDRRLTESAGRHDWSAKASHHCRCMCEMHGPEHTPESTTRDAEDGEPSQFYCNLCSRSVYLHTVRHYCTTCGDLLSTSSEESGHGEHPSGDGSEDPQNAITCGETLKNGAICGTVYAGGVCPNASNHQDNDEQGGQTGGTGGLSGI